jgi:hypothetical protein
MGYSARPGNPGGKGPDDFEFLNEFFLIHWESNFMSLNLGTKVLAGAIAMAIGGAAMANTNLDATTTGDVFLNIVNTTNDTSFLYDTGISQANFTSSTSFSMNLASDPNYQTFIASSGTLDFSVESGLSNGTTNPNKFSVDVTGNTVPVAGNAIRGDLGGAEEAMSNFLVNANTVLSSTSNSAFLSGTATAGPQIGAAAFWGNAVFEGGVSSNLFANGIAPFNDQVAPGTALTFYSESVNAGVNVLGTWNLNGSVLAFNGAGAGTGTSPVPLPTPLLLLLSGLGLMGVVARRGKPSTDLASGAAAV